MPHTMHSIAAGKNIDAFNFPIVSRRSLPRLPQTFSHEPTKWR
jgi:hypothetical protein